MGASGAPTPVDREGLLSQGKRRARGGAGPRAVSPRGQRGRANLWPCDVPQSEPSLDHHNQERPQ